MKHKNIIFNKTQKHHSPMEHKNINPQFETQKDHSPNGTQIHHSPMEHKNIIPQWNTKTSILNLKRINPQ
jgi:hypothetical protein